jgi:DNA (cytosine-5)-methyltransferase 1
VVFNIQKEGRRDVEVPTHLDLFSGIGGFALAAQWAGFRTVAFVELDKYCQKVLAKNFMGKSIGEGLEGCDRSCNVELQGGTESLRPTWSPSIHHNIFDFDGTAYRGVDLITGGFPCQPFSVAGKRRGAADDRAIWPEMRRVIKEARPAWVLGENVPGLIPMELDNVLSDMEGIGYATRAFVIPACAVDARHRRDRVFIVGRRIHADTADDGSNRDGSSGSDEWLPESGVGRVAHGIPARVDRLKGLGNAIVPQVAYEILLQIRKLI